MQIFRGCYPFTDARTEVFQVPLTWFTLMYFCIYTALLYPIRDASGAGIHVLLRAKSRALWWFSKCLALTVWNLLYFAVGFCSVCVFCFFTNGLSCFTILPYDVLPCDALTCLLPFGFALAISLLAFCLCIFCSFVWGQVFAISCLVAVSFTEFPSPFLCYAMLIRCRAMSPAGFDERAGLLFYLIFAGIVYTVHGPPFAGCRCCCPGCLCQCFGFWCVRFPCREFWKDTRMYRTRYRRGKAGCHSFRLCLPNRL